MMKPCDEEAARSADNEIDSQYDEAALGSAPSVSSSSTQRLIVIVSTCLFLVAVASSGIASPVAVDIETTASNQYTRRTIELIDKLGGIMFGGVKPQDKYVDDFLVVDDMGHCPAGPAKGEKYPEVYKIWFNNELGMVGDDGPSINTKKSRFSRGFDVDPNHTALVNGTGVMFNVETVRPALFDDANKPRLDYQDIYKSVKEEANEFYTKPGETWSFKQSVTSNFSIEVMSKSPEPTEEEGGRVFSGAQGFLAACMMAFANHLPLALKPDDIWTVISNGFARHVTMNAEELRHNFVAHEGKKEIKIQEDHMKKGKSTADDWETLIFPKFSEALLENMNNTDAHKILAGQNFSTTTAASQAASEIALMAGMKSYFEYTMMTMCGIPTIRLDGTRNDWVRLRNRTEALSQWMVQNNTHGDLWVTDNLLPILDEFIASYDGNVNYCFWQNMIKFRKSGSGSGAFDFLSGWLPTLFPYLGSLDGDKPNPHLRPWTESASSQHLGPKPTEIPHVLSSVPVKWEYFEKEFDMHFHAGFRGVFQEPDGTLRPEIGWYVTQDP